MIYRQFRRADGKGWLNSSEILSSVSVTAADSDGLDVSSSMISNAAVFSNTYVVFLLKAGTAGEVYTITITAVTNNSQTFVHKIGVTVL